MSVPVSFLFYCDVATLFFIPTIPTLLLTLFCVLLYMHSIDAVLCGGAISLMSSIPRIESPSKQRLAVIIWMGIITVMYSVLILFFRAKNPSYPFRLLF